MFKNSSFDRTPLVDASGYYFSLSQFNKHLHDKKKYRREWSDTMIRAPLKEQSSEISEYNAKFTQ